MRNSIGKLIYHWFVCRWYGMKTFRGGWALAHFYWEDYKHRKASLFKIASVHLRGWSYSDWSVLGITDANWKQYLSTRDYCSMHPFNGKYSFWIDDKLTLKYVLNGTKAGRYMPDYYFMLEGRGMVLPLMDVDSAFRSMGMDGVVALLEKKKLLALKLVKGSLGIGFYKAEYDGNAYYLNGEKLDRQAFKARISGMEGYLVTEYLLPHAEFAKFCDKSVGCLRYVIGRKKNNELIEISSYMRFGTKKSKFVENYDQGGVMAIVRNGEYESGNILDKSTDTNQVVRTHPDNGLEIKGRIPHWEKVVEAARIVAETLPQLSYLGIDFCITNDERVKIIEINSLSSLVGIEADGSIFDSLGGEFFKERLKQ